jgi:hypothetical protein
MTIPPEINSIVESLNQELDEALEFAQEVDEKIQGFNTSSAQIADKWQKKVESKVEKYNA